MDTANKTERISAPDTKHDDFCDSCVIAIHATLSMLPASGTFTSVSVNKPIKASTSSSKWSRDSGLFTTKMRTKRISKRMPRGL